MTERWLASTLSAKFKTEDLYNYFSGYILMLILCQLFFGSCAEQRPLTGGPKDTKAPELDSTKYSTKNFSTNFKEKEIILTFNEWIVLNDPLNQIIFSPPLKVKPDIKIKHKSLVIKFKEELNPSTTYTIQFGESIRDFTENNPVQNFKFVFSAGDILDSLTLNGQIADALTGNPSDKVWVMLYDNLVDSVPYLERPLYVSKTDAQGFFKFENLKSDSFRIFALQDNNSNYRFDQKSEAIAFFSEPFFLTDTSKGTFRLKLFKEDDITAIQSAKLVSNNHYKIIFSQPLYDSLFINPLVENLPGFSLLSEISKDSVVFWWQGVKEFKMELTIPNLNFRDTVNVSSSEDLKTEKIRIINEETDNQGGKAKVKTSTEKKFYLHPKDKNMVDFNQPILSFDTTKIILIDSFGKKINYKLTNIQNQNRKLELNTAEDSLAGNCTLMFLPNSLRDFFGNENNDTLYRKYTIYKETELGNLKLKVIGADSMSNYLIQMLDEKDLVIQSFEMNNTSIWEQNFYFLVPKKYSFIIIQDKDKNGRLTTGNYLQKIQPENLTRSKPITIRANWENEMEIDLKPVAKKK
jgi:hypothetical protein